MDGMSLKPCIASYWIKSPLGQSRGLHLLKITNMKINEAFRAYLHAHGIKQKDLAEAGGYGEGPMSKALAKDNWNMKTTARMMEALGRVAPEKPWPYLMYRPDKGWEVGGRHESDSAIRCPECGSTDIMMPDVGFHERDKCLECGARFR